jgi:predicted RNA-binding Zn ribbon-like protein
LSFASEGLSVQASLDDGVWRREQTSCQPGDRPTAPGQLALLQAFLNTHFDLINDRGADLLGSVQGLRSWLGSRDLIDSGASLSDADLARALAVREGLRQLLAWPSESSRGPEGEIRQELNEALVGSSIELRFTEAGLRFVPSGAGVLDRALGILLGVAASAILAGRWPRLKVCPGRHCGWVFYDHSRNNSGRWCSMTVCGGREKARAHYRRHLGK